MNVKVGSVDNKLEGDRSQVRFIQTNMAHLVLAAQMERTNADFAVMSGGGIRDSIKPGDITYKDVMKVHPFANQLVYVDFKGSEVLPYLTAVANMEKNSGAYGQFYNVSFEIDGKNISNVKIGGKPLDLNKTYRMATLNFNAIGGDGYPRIDNLPGYVDTGFVDAEVLKGYIEKHSPLKTSDYEPKGEVVRK